MADAPAISFFKSHYDQLIVTLSVLLLGASVAYLLLSVHQQRALLRDAATRVAVRGAPLDAVEMAPFLDAAAAFASPPQASIEGRRLLVSQDRVACVNPDCAKAIPRAAEICPFCGVHQPDSEAIIRDIDTDGDGIPDVWEMQYFDSPTGALAHEDFDGDGFTNLEEFLAGTDPTDATSYPPPRIRLARAAARPFNMVFQAASFLDPDRPTFQLNMLTSDRTYFAELGDVVEGYLVERYDAEAREGPTLFLRQGPREVPLVRGQIRRHDQWSGVLISLQDMRQFRVTHGATIRILSDEYKVVDITGTEVVIENMRSKESFTVPRISNEEMQELRQKRSGAVAPEPAAPAAAGGWMF